MWKIFKASKHPADAAADHRIRRIVRQPDSGRLHPREQVLAQHIVFNCLFNCHGVLFQGDNDLSDEWFEIGPICHE
jgi:hypothetical protein